MKKIETINSCDCIQKLLILGFLKEYEETYNDDIMNGQICIIMNGQICMITEKIIDNGGYNEEGEYETCYESTLAYYPIEFCPLCGKKIEYNKTSGKTLKLV